MTPAEYSGFNIACGREATPGRTVIPVAAGSKVEMLWTAWPEGHKGPVLTYLARCPGDCTGMDKTKLEFFKIGEMGMLSSGQAPGYAISYLAFFRALCGGGEKADLNQHMGHGHARRK